MISLRPLDALEAERDTESQLRFSQLGPASRLEDFDPAAPIFFFGNRTIDDPLCGIRVNDQIEGPAELTAQETACLLDYLRGCCWREDFERQLDYFGESRNGDLLAGYLPLSTFTDFVTNAKGSAVEELLLRLRILTSAWGELGVEDVQFVGIQRPLGEHQNPPAIAGREAHPSDERLTPTDGFAIGT